MSFDQTFGRTSIHFLAWELLIAMLASCHYRGRNILNWALINDEKEFDVTVHYIDEALILVILFWHISIHDSDDYDLF